jgi:hypothetical protein
MPATSIFRAIALMSPTMKAVSTSETSVSFYQTTRRNKQENNHLHTRRLVNPKYHFKFGHDSFLA